jgi:hypothetical protein
MMTTANNAKCVPIRNGVFVGFAGRRGGVTSASMAGLGIFCRNFTGG